MGPRPGAPSQSPPPGAVARVPQPITGTLLSQGVLVGPQDRRGVPALNGCSGSWHPCPEVSMGREQHRCHLSLDPSPAPSPQPPGGLHCEGDRAGTSVCGLGRTGPPGVRGRASLECLQSSPRLSATPPHVPSCQGRAGQERSSGPSASMSRALGQRPGSLHE